jgi:phage protein U
MYAQLGDIKFEVLSGFDSMSDTDDAIIAKYVTFGNKPYAVFTTPGLRELTIGMRLHQSFINVRNARLQLRAYKDNGTTLTLTWGNGQVEGYWIISNISTTTEQQDGIGNTYMVSISVTLVEAPANNLLNVKQAAVWAAAPGLSSFTTTYSTPPVVSPSPLQTMMGYISTANKVATLIDQLSYGGSFPAVGGSLGAVIGNASANLGLMGDWYSSFGEDFDIPDITGQLSTVSTYLGVCASLVPITDVPAFAVANSNYQHSNRVLARQLNVLTVRNSSRFNKFKNY